MEEDKGVEESGRGWHLKKAMTLDASAEAETPTSMKTNN
jgi:hypothetical protein